MAGYVMAGASLLSAYGSYKQGKTQKEYADRQAEIDRRVAENQSKFVIWKSEQEAAMNSYLEGEVRDFTAAKAGLEYETTVNELRRNAACTVAKGGASGFRISAGSFLSTVGDEYSYGEGIAAREQDLALRAAEPDAKKYNLAGKINLEEAKLARAGYDTAVASSLLKEDMGEEAYNAGIWGAAAELAKGYGYYERASKGKSIYPWAD